MFCQKFLSLLWRSGFLEVFTILEVFLSCLIYTIVQILGLEAKKSGQSQTLITSHTQYRPVDPEPLD